MKYLEIYIYPLLRLKQIIKEIKKANKQPDWANNLTPGQIESLERGLNDLKEGKTLSSGQFWKSYGR